MSLYDPYKLVRDRPELGALPKDRHSVGPVLARKAATGRPQVRDQLIPRWCPRPERFTLRRPVQAVACTVQHRPHAVFDAQMIP